MVFLKLLGYAVGSVLMYWGVLLLLVAPWMLAVVLILLVNQFWNQVTGKTDEWKWPVIWTEQVVQTINRIQFQWVGWIPGILIQIWYAGYAAHLVQSSTTGVTGVGAIALHITGVLAIILAAAIFYWIYTLVVEVKLPLWVYLLVGSISLIAYFVLLQQPQLATVLSDSWQRVFSAILIAATEPR